MKIVVPKVIPELNYAIYILFEHILGLSYQIELSESQSNSVKIYLLNGNELEITLDSWMLNPSYNKDFIPQKINVLDKKLNPFSSSNEVPVIFGSSKLLISDKKIKLHADFLTSSFFMLTRWEESVLSNRDSYGRFPLYSALSFRESFYRLPVVDEYAEILWNMLKFLGINQERKTWHFRFIPTHDIDNPRKWRGLHTLLRTLGGDLIKRRRFGSARRSWTSFWRTWNGKENDPYDTFDYLMDCSERYGWQSHFFFHCGGSHPLDREALPPSHPIVRQILGKIDARGHSIGFHPSLRGPHE
ncbi:MAG: hypothetical protein KatS3mg031_3128 [Chitinophagales bacterium]|nr:MAG: hypothetical protein KatS3mg031_3128 [Chitinophagales bacterium]